MPAAMEPVPAKIFPENGPVQKPIRFLFREGATESALLRGDSAEILRRLPEKVFQTCVTSPPYWSLRDYRIVGQIGLEEAVEDYIKALVRIIRQVRRVLRDDGTLWLNIGDS